MLSILAGVMGLAAALDRQSPVTVTVVLVALILCAIFMPDMVMAALVGCAVAVLVVTMGARVPELVTAGAAPSRCALPAHLLQPRGTGPPIVFPLRT